MEEDLDLLETTIQELAWNNYYEIEILKGYCENCQGGTVSSIMIQTILENIANKQKKLIKLFDEECTIIGHKLVFEN